jgi:hypothetical protein
MRHSKYGRVGSASGVRIACEVGIYVTVLRRLMRIVKGGIDRGDGGIGH